MAIEIKDYLQKRRFHLEQKMLQEILIDPSRLGWISELFGLSKDERHAILMGTMEELHREGKPIDALTILEKLRQENELEKAGGAAYLSQIMDYGYPPS